MSRVLWTTSKIIRVGEFHIPCVDVLEDQPNHTTGIQKEDKLKVIVKNILSPLIYLRKSLLIDGFIKREVGSWMRKIVNEKTVFLEVGCGAMNLKRYLPEQICYNAFDISFSEFQLKKMLKKNSNINVALASATDIPLPADEVSLIVSTECFEHIPDIDKAIKELYRVAQRDAILLCSIPNNYCYKYVKKGPHPEHLHSWTYDGFVKYMGSFNFKLLEGFMKGFWIPLPLYLTKTSYHLPLALQNEFYNTHFFYMFEVIK